MSIADVEQAVRDAVGSHVLAVGRELRPLRVTRMTLVAPNQPYDLSFQDGSSSSGTLSQTELLWAVEAEGTFHSCFASCGSFALAIVIVDDATGSVVDTLPREPTTDME